MKNTKTEAMAAGMIAGAVLTLLAVILIFGMDTGIGGAVLIFITMIVAGSTGFLMGRLQKIQKFDRRKE